ncbi:sigma-54-dependent Fis family transcriptional regulator [Clostridium hydrogeniformans]|uniref:sigma-54-dependent Fis family transcriptional regulator n=1 Tax=Clostridium hydrogeniformans TaxID=349933 RepID=UPI00047F206B|nr:sigma-54-dependent Fis family transcriptional regulator [Clostridium hydrogeniformans]
MVGENREILIKKSHERSEGYGVLRNISCSKKIIYGEEVNEILHHNKKLIEISKYYIDMVHSALNDDDFIIVLTDKEGCILYIKGHDTITKDFQKINFVVGAYMNEKNIGTNAMGTAIKEDKAVQITAKEHYINMFQDFTCSAAPIHNTRGEVIGSLNLTGKYKNKHPHTLGLIIFGVRAIENELYKQQTNIILNETYSYMESIIDNLDKGIIIVDIKGKVRNINKLGLKRFNKDKDEIVDKNIEYLVPNWKSIYEYFKEGNKSYNKEIKFEHNSKYKTLLKFKPVRIKDKVIGMVLILSDKKEENNNLKNTTGAFYNFEDIIGNSAAIENVITNCRIISNSPSTVLIEGESGTGKEVLAQAMHNYSHRKNNKFIAINCGAIPESIIESELFGYEEGTFTGGLRGGKKGKFESANGGTLFLDEIGDMPLDMQVKLLRVLQESRVTRLGGNREIPLDIRVIAATNRNLKEEIKIGKFREDLYYRISVIPIRLPPLRERKGDPIILINYFLRIKAFKLNKSIPSIEKELLDKLINYRWPGNIRQLENSIENLVNLKGNISFDLFEEEVKTIKNEEEIQELNLESYIGSLNDMEKLAIIKTLRVYKGNITKTSKKLGISRNTLYSKIKKFNIEL